MWKIKNKEAVSPVIGVILMVAITVVLAAVLYVWVSGFMGGGGAMTPTGAIGGTVALTRVDTNSYNVTNSSVASISPATDGSKIKWYILDAGGISQYSGTLGSPVTSNDDPGTVHVHYRDNDADNKLSTGDIIQIEENPASTIASGWSLRLAYTDTGGTIATLSFTT